MVLETDFKEIAKRNEQDLDSICIGSPSKHQVKLYVNTRIDKEEDILTRIDMLVSVSKYALRKMEGEK